MAYASDKKPLELTEITALASDDTIIVGDTSDTSEVVKQITVANLKTEIGSGSGDMSQAVYDPTNVEDDVFDRDNHTGTQSATTITGTKTHTFISDFDSAIADVAGTVVSLGNLGTSETVDWDDGTYYHGTLDSNVTITHSNEAEGRSITLILSYDGSAQRAITWSNVDEWSQGETPTAPSSASRELIVTLLYVNGACYGFHSTATSGGGGASDHGALTGLTDDDHTQYSLISSQAGAPSSTPSRVGEVNIDTTDDEVYISTGTASSADWTQVDGTGGGGVTVTSGAGAPSTTPDSTSDQYIDTDTNNRYFAFGVSSYSDWRYVATTANPYVPAAADNAIFEDDNNIIFEDGNNMTYEA